MEHSTDPASKIPSEDRLRARRAWSGLVIEVFRLNGDLLEAGDTLVEDLGLTSARWQVLGAVDLAPAPLPVAHIARNMGLARQSVQRLVDDMLAEGLVRLAPNPHHRRAALVAMTPRGEAAYREAMARKDLLADALAEGLAPEALEAAGALLRVLQQRIDAGRGRIASLATTTRQETRG
ncbi:MarR family winged helix-turn-helix transcriptional regulator [Methylobacterium nonmethylotrophicum]|uniref:MarR family transcriptional regulator n=1 Tax=Methylobacterium nonmethylotrophicum TaxID=1141884 RepID=A0A4Z0NV08_9HYPH|nr:helix-turn-helix domain-containing protein [Methylobacterium nonmethylotrophicum]TGE01113.1 MarR family transcriptional regulator [Methylobacterium nonmethylotrophicum]